MNIITQIKSAAAATIESLYGIHLSPESVLINQTKPEFEGDYTVVLFSFVKQLRKSPEALGQEIGEQLVKGWPDLFTDFNVIKGFLNLSVADRYWQDFLEENLGGTGKTAFGQLPATGERVMVEYSSPNTNKPLHLGHLRNNFLGYSITEILKCAGNEVFSSCVVNDRGIHICKSMIAWQMFSNGATPASTGIKGDHFVGQYYVKFNDEYKLQVQALIDSGLEKELAEKQAPIMEATQQMLLDWEAGKPEVIELWKKMNSWVYEGFDVTYNTIGTTFDKVYYESNTYLLGKDLVEQGLAKKVFYKKEDGSVWIDLTQDGLDEKLVRRSDGTSVYITQDIGLAEQKQKEFNIQESIYVVGDEQNYHFKVLKLICQKLGLPSADGIYHLSYGMVELPSGKMKSREGTVVDADDLIANMIEIARQKTEELGKVSDFNEEELAVLYNMIGLGALKFFLLRVDPKKKMLFNPEESIDFHGFTGPFVQYTYARIKSILRKLELQGEQTATDKVATDLLKPEKEVLVALEQYPALIQEAADEHDPSKIAIYVFNLAKLFNALYAELSILNAESKQKKMLRSSIALLTGDTIKRSMALLGIEVPERM
ncbi:arginine--tRNA ligase [Arachidicoccus terrestris]|uniref:arginine--tRNA ligase n=1 Tax=Arachidicoccus terrestris TaxID=2875539 RepID=UPI001CC37A9B|nr:arginine--tRNA ligase [Arachidicoccus terrestris]UAY55226.1 arginine--tRNA ligase [Arachidicoccus terrestris]